MTAGPTLAVRLADVVAHSIEDRAGGWALVGAALRALDRIAASPVDDDLQRWAGRIGAPEGLVPLFGTGLRAPAYPGLLWAGERCARTGSGREVSIALVGLAVGAEHSRGAADLSRAVRAGLAVAHALEDRFAAVRDPAGVPTRDVVATATCAAVLADVPPGDLAAVLDLAGSLMAITPPVAESAGAWSGHSAAAGWLAVRTWSSGLVGMPDGLDHTLTTVATPDDPPGEPPQDVAVSALLERLR